MRSELLLLLSTAAADPLIERALTADVVVEATVSFDGRRQTAKAERVLWPPDAAPPELSGVSPVPHSCARKAGTAKALVFLRRTPEGRLEALPADARATSLHPDYGRLVEAVSTARSWQEERMRAVPAQMLWSEQREVLARSDNPYLLSLAVAFLSSKDASAVVDEVWGAAGTFERKKNEARAVLPPARCPSAR